MGLVHEMPTKDSVFVHARDSVLMSGTQLDSCFIEQTRDKESGLAQGIQ